MSDRLAPYLDPENRGHGDWRAEDAKGFLYLNDDDGCTLMVEDADVAAFLNAYPSLVRRAEALRLAAPAPDAAGPALCGCDGEHCGDGPVCGYVTP